MEMSEDSGDLVIGTMYLLVGSAVGCSRNVVNVGRIVLQEPCPFFSYIPYQSFWKCSGSSRWSVWYGRCGCC